MSNHLLNKLDEVLSEIFHGRKIDEEFLEDYNTVNKKVLKYVLKVYSKLIQDELSAK